MDKPKEEILENPNEIIMVKHCSKAVGTTAKLNMKTIQDERELELRSFFGHSIHSIQVWFSIS